MRYQNHKYITLHGMEEVLSNATECSPRPVTVPTWSAINMIAARDVLTTIDLPFRAKAAYDGFAISSNDAPGRFRLVGSVRVGEVPSFSVGRMEAVYVTTGAYLPDGGVDAVVPEEDAELDGDQVTIGQVEKGANVDAVGSYATRGGSKVLRAGGELITGHVIPALTEMGGIMEVEAYGKLRVAVLSTGSELIRPRDVESARSAFLSGKVIESTGSLAAWFISSYMPYLSVNEMDLVVDDVDEVRHALRRLIDNNDIVITTGGSGPGDIDYAWEGIKSLNPRWSVRGMRMRPGRPTSVAVIGDCKVVFGLSGHPISALNALINLVDPFVKRMLGIRRAAAWPIARGKLTTAVNAEPGFLTQVRVRASIREGGELLFTPLGGGSSVTSSLAATDGLITLRGGPAPSGAVVDAFMLREPGD